MILHIVDFLFHVCKYTCSKTWLEEELAFLLNAFFVPNILCFFQFQEVLGQLFNDEQILCTVTHEWSFLTLQRDKEDKASGLSWATNDAETSISHRFLPGVQLCLDSPHRH